MRTVVWSWAAPLVVSVSLVALGTPAPALEIGPESNLCAAIETVAAGEEVVLRPGEYRGPCKIRRSGTPGMPLVIRAQDPARRPRIVYDGRASNVIELRSSHVTLQGLEFGPTRRHVDAVRIYGGRGFVIESCHFTGLGGIAVAANHASVEDVVVRRNVVESVNATAIYFGCHDGRGCRVTGARIEGNIIRGVSAAAPEIGYGIQVKLNSAAVIRDNVVSDTKGPGIMVFGATDLAVLSVVERNVVIGSRRSSGIVIGGGPALVRNNVTVGSSRGSGIGIEDYRARGLLHGIVVAHNTVYGNAEGGVSVEGAVHEAVVANNAVHAPPGARALPAARRGLRIKGNVDCSHLRCFARPDARDFSPLPELVEAGGPDEGPEPWMPRDDLFGSPRGGASVPGAIARAGHRLPGATP